MPIQPRHIAILFRRFTSFGEDVTRPYIDAIEAREHSASARRRQGLPRTRRSRDDPRRAGRQSSGPTTSCRCSRRLKGPLFAIDDAHLLEFRHRFGAFHPFRIPKELGGNSGQELALSGEADAASRADRRRAAAAAGPASAAQLPAGRRHHRASADRDPRARRLHPAAGRRAGAGQRAARRGAGAAVRGIGRHFVPRIHRRAARGGGDRSGRSADSRREQRRRAPDDRAQGQGPRVPGRHPRGPDVPYEPRRRSRAMSMPAGSCAR